MCNDRRAFKKGSLRGTNVLVKLGDHNKVHVSQQGIAIIDGVQLDALFVPEFRISLLSVSQLDKLGFHTSMANSLCTISKSKDAVPTLVAPQIDGLYRIQPSNSTNAFISTRSMTKRQRATSTSPSTLEKSKPTASQPNQTVSPLQSKREINYRKLSLAAKRTSSMQLWHRRLAHLHPNSMKKILPNVQFSEDLDPYCDTCIKAKHKQRFERTRVPRSIKPFDLIHSDLCGPLEHSIGGAAYYIIYIDDCTRYTEIYFLTTKTSAEVISKFAHFKAWVTSQGYQIRRFRCDNGKGEFDNADFLQMLGDHGITYEPSPPYTQHKNGVSERMIQTLNAKARCMMLDAYLPMKFWAEAVRTACYIHCRTPTSSLPDNKSPYEMLYGTTP